MKLLRKIDAFYIITFIFLLLTSNANFLSVGNIYWFAALLLITLLAIIKKAIGKKDLIVILRLSLIYLLFVTARDLLINNLDFEFLISDITFLLKYILFSFIYVSILKKNTVNYLVTVMTHLTVISFFFYFLQLVGFADLLVQFSKILNLPAGVNEDTEGYTNLIIFTYVKYFHDYQNSGFLWEPGAFGCFLSITLLLRFVTNDFRFDKQSKVLILGILTTFSTTNYLALLVLLFLAYRYRYPNQNKWLLFIIPLFILLLITIPFLGEKIGETYYNDIDALTRLTVLQRYYHRQNQLIPLNRFASMEYIYQTFREKLIAGVCTKYDVILNRKMEVDISNGIADFIARFGIIGFLFLIFRYSKFCLMHIKRKELLLYCIAVFLIVGFGEPLLQLPITLIFLFLADVYGDEPAKEILPKTSRFGYERTAV